MDPITQFHVARKVAPVMGAFKDSELIRAAISSAPMTDDERVAAAIAMIEPLTQVLAQMKEEDANYVLDKCLSGVVRCKGEVTPGNPWTAIWNRSAQTMMYSDVDMATMMRIVFNVLMESFSGFFPASLSPSVGVVQGR